MIADHRRSIVRHNVRPTDRIATREALPRGATQPWQHAGPGSRCGDEQPLWRPYPHRPGDPRASAHWPEAPSCPIAVAGSTPRSPEADHIQTPRHQTDSNLDDAQPRNQPPQTTGCSPLAKLRPKIQRPALDVFVFLLNFCEQHTTATHHAPPLTPPPPTTITVLSYTYGACI